MHDSSFDQWQSIAREDMDSGVSTAHQQESNIGNAVGAVLVLLIAAAVIRMVLPRIPRIRRTQQQAAPQLTSCPNPNCIRCQRYRQVQASARTRMPWVARQVRQNYPDEDDKSLDRVCDSIRHPQLYCRKVQAPTVLMVRDLSSKEVVTDMHTTPSLEQYFSEKGKDFVNIILAELSGTPDELWNRNDTLTGSWEVLPLLNQGRWNHSVSKICPNIHHLVSNMPNLLDDCLFGNAMVSKIYPGTWIEPHCGPTNVRHRLQFTLHVPSNQEPHTSSSSNNNKEEPPCLRVGSDTRLSWRKPGDFFVFDDSFVHSVHYGDRTQETASQPYSSSPNATEGRIGHRMVLIVDLWHPNLSQAERTLICYMYPPFLSQKRNQPSFSAVNDKKLE